jgi:mono/diheme cytochrome c family protein
MTFMLQTFIRRNVFRLLAAATATVWVGLVADQAVLGQAKAVSEGVYTAAQADRGQKQFEATCASCHDTMAFMGNDFAGNWGGKPVGDLFEKVKTTMPEDNPGSLKPQQYADIIAYFLKLNEFPAGQTELKGDAESMKGLLIDKKGK